MNKQNSHHKWKGSKASYSAKHMRIYKKFGSPNICENCGIDKVPKGKKRWFEWANISGKYKTQRSDWKRLCKNCHEKMDIHLKTRGSDHHSTILTNDQVLDIKRRLRNRERQVDLAKKFHVAQSTISHIKNSKTWHHIN